MEKIMLSNIPSATLTAKVIGNMKNTKKTMQSFEHFLYLHTFLHQNSILPIIGPIKRANGMKIRIKNLKKIFIKLDCY